MPLYFIIQHNREIGPLEKEELKKIQLQPDTLVWRYGFAGWRAAGSMEELARLLPPSPFHQFIVQEEETLEEEPVQEQEEKPAIPRYRYGYYFTTALLLFGLLLPSYTYSPVGVVVYTALAIGAWWSLQQFFVLAEDKTSANFIWGIVGAYVVYLLTYLVVTDVRWVQEASETIWAVGFCRTFGRCSPEAVTYADRLTEGFQLLWPWLALLSTAVLIVAFRLWKVSTFYDPTLIWLTWTSFICIPAWMFVHLMDRSLGTTSIGSISAVLLMSPYVLLLLFLNEMDE